MVSPSLPEFLRLVAQGKRVPLRARIPADLDTPVSAYLKFRPHGAVFLLESIERGIQIGRYSFIGIGPTSTVKLQNDVVTVRRNGSSWQETVDAADPFAVIRRELGQSDDLLTEELPGPFAGAVGYIGYEIVRYFEPVTLPGIDRLDLPDYQFIFPGTLAVIDHVKSEIEILALPSLGPSNGVPEESPEEAYRAGRELIGSLLAALEEPLPASPERSDLEPPAVAVSNLTEQGFCDRVRQAKEHILAGDAFQIVLSQRLSGQTQTSPFQIYRALRILNPSPYMFFADFGDFQAIGSSPEMLVKLSGRQVTLCPIAGTRPRGDTPGEDRSLEQELLASDKERAEHVMLVDLGRNDLGRVCEIGSVQPESLLQIEKYSHVMHIVSRLRGQLRAELDMFDLLRAVFPAGTVTGAPKIRAMEIISELEGEKRGPYAGAVGYFGRQGDMDMCITIRTLLMKGSHYFAQAGAGIVADSDPAFEYRETLAKIQALVKAITIAEQKA